MAAAIFIGWTASIRRAEQDEWTVTSEAETEAIMLRGFMTPIFRAPIGVGGIATMLLVIAIGCSSGGPEPTPTPTGELAQATPASSPEPTTAPVVEPTAVPIPTVEPTRTPSPSPTAAPAPTATPVATPTAIAESNIYNRFGFTVELDQDATFGASDLNVGGWTETEADVNQGLMTFIYNGVDVVIFWQPHGGDTPQATVDLTYQLQKLGQPDRSFTPISDGNVTVDGHSGRFVGFLSTDGTGKNASGGLVSAWTCQDSETQVSLTATGPDATALQIRFDRLTSGFKCAES